MTQLGMNANGMSVGEGEVLADDDLSTPPSVLALPGIDLAHSMALPPPDHSNGVRADGGQHEYIRSGNGEGSEDSLVPLQWSLNDFWSNPVLSRQYNRGQGTGGKFARFERYFLLLTDPSDAGSGKLVGYCRICPLTDDAKKLSVSNSTNLLQHLNKRSTNAGGDFHRRAYEDMRPRTVPVMESHASQLRLTQRAPGTRMNLGTPIQLWPEDSFYANTMHSAVLTKDTEQSKGHSAYTQYFFVAKNREDMKYAFCRICPIDSSTKPIRYYNPSNLAQHLRKQKYQTPGDPHAQAYAQAQAYIKEKGSMAAAGDGTGRARKNPAVGLQQQHGQPYVLQYGSMRGSNSGMVTPGDHNIIDQFIPMWPENDIWNNSVFSSQFTPEDVVVSKNNSYSRFFVILREKETGNKYAVCRICPLTSASKKLRLISQSNLSQHLKKRSYEVRKDAHSLAYDLAQRDIKDTVLVKDGAGFMDEGPAVSRKRGRVLKRKVGDLFMDTSSSTAKSYVNDEETYAKAIAWWSAKMGIPPETLTNGATAMMFQIVRSCHYSMPTKVAIDSYVVDMYRRVRNHVRDDLVEAQAGFGSLPFCHAVSRVSPLYLSVSYVSSDWALVSHQITMDDVPVNKTVDTYLHGSGKSSTATHFRPHISAPPDSDIGANVDLGIPRRFKKVTGLDYDAMLVSTTTIHTTKSNTELNNVLNPSTSIESKGENSASLSAGDTYWCMAQRLSLAIGDAVTASVKADHGESIKDTDANSPTSDLSERKGSLLTAICEQLKVFLNHNTQEVILRRCVEIVGMDWEIADNIGHLLAFMSSPDTAYADVILDVYQRLCELKPVLDKYYEDYVIKYLSDLGVDAEEPDSTSDVSETWNILEFDKSVIREEFAYAVSRRFTLWSQLADVLGVVHCWKRLTQSLYEPSLTLAGAYAKIVTMYIEYETTEMKIPHDCAFGGVKLYSDLLTDGQKMLTDIRTNVANKFFRLSFFPEAAQLAIFLDPMSHATRLVKMMSNLIQLSHDDNDGDGEVSQFDMLLEATVKRKSRELKENRQQRYMQMQRETRLHIPPTESNGTTVTSTPISLTSTHSPPDVTDEIQPTVEGAVATTTNVLQPKKKKLKLFMDVEDQGDKTDMEVSSFVSASCCITDSDTESLNWWRQYSTTNSELALLARLYLSMRPTANPGEVFKLACGSPKWRVMASALRASSGLPEDILLL
eukprot:CFRG5135T1